MAANPYIPFIQQSAGHYGTDPGVLVKVAQLESSFNPNAINNWDSNAKAGHPSYGMFQFIQPTFSAYASRARAANPAAWKGVPQNWKNWKAQALAASWAIAHGKGNAWTTMVRAKQEAGSGLGQATPTPGQPSLAGSNNKDSIAFGLLAKRTSSPMLRNLFEGFGANADAEASQSPSNGVPAESDVSLQPLPKNGLKGPTLNRILAIGKRFGLPVTSTTEGKHAAHSYHYSGRAVDFGLKGDTTGLQRWALQNAPRITEFFSPADFYIKDGKVYKGRFPGHSDHIHLAL